MIYEKEVLLEDSHTDRFGRLKLSVLLGFLQQMAGAQCTAWGLDWESLQSRGLFWAVTRNQVVLHRVPVLGEKIRLRTWPVEPTRSAYPRAMEVHDGQGNLVAQVMSLWVLMDTKKRSMVLPGRSGVEVPGVHLGTELALPASIAPVVGEVAAHRQVVFSELDRNGHMSNTRYLDWAMDFVGGQLLEKNPPRAFRIAYLSEALEGETLGLKAHWEENRLLLEGVREGAPSRVFALELEL